MEEEELKVDDIVWVNERSPAGEILKHEWKGKITWISKDGTVANVQDLDSDGGLFWRDTRKLEKSNGEESCQ
ncbi:unnamed protein product [marine sediment metagenome]|uniref:Hypervirulence associated protein TUDOR domain-containing protein n=1 Tax=marine sediment metagenome TaxID=412755 RepID=X1AB48_9ZZZZ